MKIPAFQIDAFTDQPFSGNPAAVCPLDKWLPEEAMQSIAAEMNLSETAFFVPSEKQNIDYEIRWFTPTVEVDLCGHATLASGHVVFSKLEPNLDQVAFSSRSGRLTVERQNGMLELDFPSNPPSPLQNRDEVAAVESALGASPIEVLHANTTVAVFETESQVANLKPDFAAVANLKEPWIAATAPADADEFDFVSRFFVPTAGVNEDPATGSSHTVLTPYWSKKFGRTELVGRQISRRGGTMYCRLVDERVNIAGHVVDVMTGEITIE